MKLVPRSLVTAATLLSFTPFAHASEADLAAYRTSNFLLGTAPTGCQPKGLKTDAQGDRAYVAEMCGKKVDGVRHATVSVYNLKTLSLETTIFTPDGITTIKDGRLMGNLGNAEVEFTQDGNYVLASRIEGNAQTTIFPNYGMITAIDAQTQQVKEYIPVNGKGSKIIEDRPMVEGDSHEIVYVSNYFSNDISVIDVTGLSHDTSRDGTGRFVKTIKLHTAFPAQEPGAPAIAPRGSAFTADGKYALVDASTTGSIFIVDSVHHTQIAELGPIPQDLGAVPERQQINGKSMNVRHIVLTKDRGTAYISHMRGDAISRIDVNKLVSMAVAAAASGHSVLPSSVWHELLIPFPNGKSIISLPHYSADHPPLYTATGQAIPIADRDWDLVRPNTIVLDPVDNRYLYVSCRTDTDPNYNNYSDRTQGKVDIIDTTKGEVIFSLVGGVQPTALEVTPDNSMLISGGFKDSKLYFFDLKKILSIYEN